MKVSERGFTLSEIMVSIGIMTLLFSIGIYSWSDVAKNKEVTTITDAIVAELEEARSNSITGKNGSNYGIKFDSDRYISFVGTSYIESSSSNQITQVPSKITLSNNIPGSDDKIVFSKIRGESSHSNEVTVTVSATDGSFSKQILIGPLGNISIQNNE